jgi:hypothetical protein
VDRGTYSDGRAPAVSKEKKSMDPMYDSHYWSKQRREEQIGEAQRRSLAKQGKGERKTPRPLSNWVLSAPP